MNKQDFMKKYKDEHPDWHFVSEYQKMSEKFMNELINELPSESVQEELNRILKETGGLFEDYYWWWREISRDCDLSEDFIREYQDDVHWDCISINQKLSKDFIIEFKDKLNLKLMVKYCKVPDELYEVKWNI